MGERFTRRPFLKSVLAEANRQRRNQLLRLANADQINTLSELAMNTVRGVVPRSRDTVRLLRPFQDTLKQMMQRRRSVKNRRELMMAQSGGAFWRELHRCFLRCCHGLSDQCPRVPSLPLSERTDYKCPRTGPSRQTTQECSPTGQRPCHSHPQEEDVGPRVVGLLMPPKQRKTRRQRGGKLDLQKMLQKTGIEFHWPGYQYMGPGTHSISIIAIPSRCRTSKRRID